MCLAGRNREQRITGTDIGIIPTISIGSSAICQSFIYVCKLSVFIHAMKYVCTRRLPPYTLETPRRHPAWICREPQTMVRRVSSHSEAEEEHNVSRASLAAGRSRASRFGLKTGRARPLRAAALLVQYVSMLRKRLFCFPFQTRSIFILQLLTIPPGLNFLPCLNFLCS